MKIWERIDGWMGEDGVLSRILNIFFPRRCIFCDCVLPFTSSVARCPDCSEKIGNIEYQLRCAVCDTPLPGKFGEPLCRTCRSMERGFIRNCAPFAYGGSIQETVKRFKFKGAVDYAHEMAAIMLGRIYLCCPNIKFDCVIPVPLSKKRLRQRGYNQTELLAKSISRLMGVPMVKALEKVRETEVQSLLNADDRSKNLENAFALKRNIEISDQVVLLIDDVFTTGSTLNECAKMLQAAQAVYCATFAVTSNE